MKEEVWFTLVDGIRFYFRTKEECETLVEALRTCLKMVDNKTLRHFEEATEPRGVTQ